MGNCSCVNNFRKQIAYEEMMKEQRSDTRIDMSLVLPEDCISQIISYTSPQDACRAALVSSFLREAADSDAVWEKFLPSDVKDIISQSSSPPSAYLNSLSKKRLYHHLCDHPIILGNGTLSFQLEKQTGKKCFMVGARDLSVRGGEATGPIQSVPDSRFSEVAELKLLQYYRIKGELETKILSPKTTYVAYLVFKLGKTRGGREYIPVQLRVYFERNKNERGRSVYLDPVQHRRPSQKDGGNGWMQAEMGEFFNEDGDDGPVFCSLQETGELTTSYSVQCSLLVEGIEFRPKF
ncbi:F-box protein [Quillaja saponaria]|uniref:F-box protein n=1 Tax=Quillaja saponaria TaxID=32244 RepID=A0AAD7QF20_QUISA|nr:F-box protein [Quillaja saponaria]